jgi:hypothetical protein
MIYIFLKTFKKIFVPLWLTKSVGSRIKVALEIIWAMSDLNRSIESVDVLTRTATDLNEIARC